MFATLSVKNSANLSAIKSLFMFESKDMSQFLFIMV